MLNDHEDAALPLPGGLRSSIFTSTGVLLLVITSEPAPIG
jgi:hypothetical protein